MLKFCRDCNCVIPGAAAFCSQCGVPWQQVLPHSLAEAADLLQPPMECVTCRKEFYAWRFFCPRCGAAAHPRGIEPPAELWTALAVPGD